MIQQLCHYVPFFLDLFQMNLKRGTERRKPEFIDSLNKPYDPNKFNFTKVKPCEILCELWPCCGENTTINGATVQNGETEENGKVRFCNTSPLAYLSRFSMLQLNEHYMKEDCV